jgi:Transposase, Mutator family
VRRVELAASNQLQQQALLTTGYAARRAATLAVLLPSPSPMRWPAWPSRVKLHSANPIARLNGEIKRRTEVVGILPNNDAIVPLVGAVLLEQNHAWAVQRALYMTLETISPMSDDPPHQPASGALISRPKPENAAIIAASYSNHPDTIPSTAALDRRGGHWRCYEIETAAFAAAFNDCNGRKHGIGAGSQRGRCSTVPLFSPLRWGVVPIPVRSGSA